MPCFLSALGNCLLLAAVNILLSLYIHRILFISFELSLPLINPAFLLASLGLINILCWNLSTPDSGLRTPQCLQSAVGTNPSIRSCRLTSDLRLRQGKSSVHKRNETAFHLCTTASSCARYLSQYKQAYSTFSIHLDQRWKSFHAAKLALTSKSTCLALVMFKPLIWRPRRLQAQYWNYRHRFLTLDRHYTVDQFFFFFFSPPS